MWPTAEDVIARHSAFIKSKLLQNKSELFNTYFKITHGMNARWKLLRRRSSSQVLDLLDDWQKVVVDVALREKQQQIQSDCMRRL